MLSAGYQVSSAYTVVRDRARTKFVYRDSLWHGADMFGTGVASFGHAHGVHMQNVDGWDQYLAMLNRNELPLNRAMPVTAEQRLIREMILQLKTGSLDSRYFQDKFGVNILERFGDGFQKLADAGNVTLSADRVAVTRQGLLQVDRLLPTFFQQEHLTSRYT